MMALFEDATSKPPDGADMAAYVKATGLKNFAVKIPVLADAPKQVFDATPYKGNALPGKCALSPRMKILKCYTGEDDTPAFDAIKADAAANP